MVAESEVPLGTAEPVLFPGAPVVPKGTQCLNYPIFPALKRWAIFSEHKDAKYNPISPRVFKLNHYRADARVFPFVRLAVPVRSIPVNTIRVDAGQQSYDVFVGSGLVDGIGELCPKQLKGASCAVVSDETVAALYGERVLASLGRAGFRPLLFRVPAGEHSKTIQSAE